MTEVIPTRTRWFCPVLSEDSSTFANRDSVQVATSAEANLVSSRLSDGRHAPAFDIDFPCELIPSSTPGHFHLYIDKPMSWEEYRILLHALAAVGIIEDGYYHASVREQQTFLRPPGHLKEAA